MFISRTGNSDERMREYEDVVSEIVRKRPELSSEEIEARIRSKLETIKFLNKLGASLLVAEELGVFTGAESVGEIDRSLTTQISNLVPGLNDVSVLCRVVHVSEIVRGERYTYLRGKLGDSTGKLNAVFWGERAEEGKSAGLKAGQVMLVQHAYTKERLDGGVPELHVGGGSTFRVVDNQSDLPTAEHFLEDVTTVVGRGSGIVDIVARALLVGPVKEVTTQTGTTQLREVLLTDGRTEAVLLAWRNKAGRFEGIAKEENVKIFDVRVRGNDFHTTSHTDVERSISEGEERTVHLGTGATRIVQDYVVRTLDVIDQGIGMKTLIGFDGRRIVRIQSPVIDRLRVTEDDYVLVKRGGFFLRRGREYVVAEENDIQKLSPMDSKREIDKPDLSFRVSQISGETSDIILEGVLYNMGPVTRVNTKFGEAEVVNYWLRDDTKALRGAAWRNKARELERMRIGTKIMLKWIKIKKNPYGELEIEIDNDSRIQEVGQDTGTK